MTSVNGAKPRCAAAIASVISVACSLNSPTLAVHDADTGGGGGMQREGGSSNGGSGGNPAGGTGGSGGKAGGGTETGGSRADAATGGSPGGGGSRPLTDASVGDDSSSGQSCGRMLGDCNHRSDDGCETNLFKDTLNCGACGHDCLGGGCQFGECQPVELAARQAFPYQIAVDAKNVYFTTQDHFVRAAPIGGGDVRTVAVSPDLPLDIATDGDFVYWITGDVFEGLPTVRRARTSATNVTDPEIVYQGVISGTITEIMSAVTTDSKNVYWSVFDRDTQGAAYYAKSKVSGAVQRLYPATGYQAKASSFSLFVQGNALYAGGSDGGGIGGSWVLRLSTAGASLEALYDGGADAGSGVYASAVNATSSLAFYTLRADSVFGPIAFGLYSVPVNGGAPRQLAQDGLGGIAADSSYVYYTAYNDIERVPINGGISHVLATNHVAREIVADDRALYWGDVGGLRDGGVGSGSVWMLAK